MHRCGRSFLSKPPTKLYQLHSSTPTLAAAESATPLPRSNALTLIHKTSALLPSILSPTPKHPVESLKLWADLLEYAHNASVVRKDSASSESRKARIVVHGAHPESGAFDLVTALLEDEFSSNPENANLLRSRPRNTTHSIRSGPTPTQSFRSLSLSSQWLTRFPTPVEVVELPTAGSDADLITLLTADIPVVVFNPIMMGATSVIQSPLYRAVLNHPRAILAIIGIETPETRNYVQSLFASHLSRSERDSGEAEVKDGAEATWAKHPRVVYVNPSHALESLYALQKNPTSLQAIKNYQHGRLSSRVSDLGGVVREYLTGSQVTPGKNTPPQVVTAIALLRQSLDIARGALDGSLREVEDLGWGISEVLGETERTKVSLRPDVLGIWDGVSGKEAEIGEVGKAMVKSKEDVKRTLDALRWWKLLWRADDVEEVVNAAIQQRWCKDLERLLVFHTGRLQAVQTQLRDKTTRLLHSVCPPSPFYSSVIYNNYQQLVSSPAYLLTPTALLQPLLDRRDMLARFPVTRLHLAAQRVVFSTLGSTAASLGVLWGNWVGLIGDVSLLGLNLSGETIVGAGILGGVAGLRWSVGLWEKAKGKFWADWERVGKGLERDLTAELDRSFDKGVAAAPAMVCDQLSSLEKKRREELTELEGQVGTLLRESRVLYPG